MYENPWIYNGKPFTIDDVGPFVGFVYLITDRQTDKKYIGKKIFHNKKSRPPLKGAKKRRISKIPSDWMEYYGSNETLKKLVETTDKTRYKREILHLCQSKSHMSYLETKEILLRNVLLDECYFNDWISCKITRKQLQGIKW